MTDSFHSSGNSASLQIELISWNKDEKQDGINTKERRKRSQGVNKINNEKMQKGKKNGKRTKRMKDMTQRKDGRQKQKGSQDQKKNERNGNIRLLNANLIVISIYIIHAASVCRVSGDTEL